ncbi:MAG: hypothetical protein FGM14_03670 [Flavobacteriales bacterium]|nr:hypothetical protein [Flavobacteriales bacterium]
MKIRSLILIWSLFLSINSFASEEAYYAVSTVSLNLRKSASTNSETITTINKGDTVKVYYVNEGWAFVKYNQKYGSVSNEFLTTISYREEVNIGNVHKNGFVAGFVDVFGSCFALIFFIGFCIISYRLRKPDARYKNGYKEEQLSSWQYFKLAIYAFIISAFFGLIGGIINLFN